MENETARGDDEAPRGGSRGRGGQRGPLLPRGGGRGGEGGRGGGGGRGMRGGGQFGGGGGGYGGDRGGYSAGNKRPAPGYNSGDMAMGGGTLDFTKKRKINDNVYRVLIPVRAVRMLIGPKGDNIKVMKEKAGEDCKISIYTQGTNKEPLIEGSMDRVMSIEASLEAFEKIIAEAIPKLQPAPLEKLRGKMDVRLLIPAHTCSAVIGPKGAHVKAIKEETSTFVQVFTCPMPNSGEHVVSLKNDQLEPLAKAASKVCEAILEMKGQSHISLYDPQVWTPGDYGETGSYLDDSMFQQNRGGFQQGGRGRGGGGRGNFNQRGGRGFNNNNRGGYNNQQQGGYGNQRGGFGNQRGGYNQGNQGGQNQGGYDQQGGFNTRGGNRGYQSNGGRGGGGAPYSQEQQGGDQGYGGYEEPAQDYNQSQGGDAAQSFDQGAGGFANQSSGYGDQGGFDQNQGYNQNQGFEQNQEYDGGFQQQRGSSRGRGGGFRGGRGAPARPTPPEGQRAQDPYQDYSEPQSQNFTEKENVSYDDAGY